MAIIGGNGGLDVRFYVRPRKGTSLGGTACFGVFCVKIRPGPLAVESCKIGPVLTKVKRQSGMISIDLWLRFSSYRAFGHIGQQLGTVLNGQLQYILPPPTWSRPSANPVGMFCATSSWNVLFYVCHPLESSILPLSPLNDLVSALYDQPNGICVLLQCLTAFWSWPRARFPRL